MAIKTKDIKAYFNDTEFKSYLWVIFFVFVIINIYVNIGKHEGLTVMQILFQSVSFITTSGFTSTTYYSWPSFIISLLIAISFIGACAGSTGGGLKVIRVIILFKLLKKELLKIIHPTAEIPIRINQSTINEETSATLYNFFIFYILSYLALSFLLLMSGLDMVTSFSAVASCINNLGPGLGDVALNYGNINIFAKYVLSFAMILGRLEIFTLLIVMTPYFWKY
jgi:trk system potassium uptake protein TrkH